MRSRTTARSALVTVAGLFMAAAFAEAKPFRRSILAGDDEAAYEWSAVFATDANEHTWLMQKVNGEYADASMKLVIYALTETPTYDNAAEMLGNKAATADTEMESDDDCVDLAEGGSITPEADGSCVKLIVNDASNDSS